LQSAYSSATHLSTRLTNLSLLSEFGKNAWLVHNAQLEDILKRLEEDLMYAKTERELVNKDRKGMQKDVEADMKRLQGRWKKSVGRVLEVEVATEALRREIVDRQRGS
jgi:pre-mRNA-splicing factor SPF27